MKTIQDWMLWFHKTKLSDPNEKRSAVEVLVEMVQKDAVASAADVAASYEPRCESCPSGAYHAILHLIPQ